MRDTGLAYVVVITSAVYVPFEATMKKEKTRWIRVNETPIPLFFSFTGCLSE